MTTTDLAPLETTGLAPRDVIHRAEREIERALALLQTDPFAGLLVAAHTQKAMKIYGRALAEAKVSGRTSNLAAAARLRAERVAGEALGMIERERGRPEKNSIRRVSNYQTALKGTGITQPTAHRWQTVAAVPAPTFDAYVEQVDRDRELTTGELLRAHVSVTNRRERTDKLNTIARGGSPLALPQRYPILYVDPPWQYEHVKTESRAIENHYPTMSLAELDALEAPVTEASTPDAVLFLWATSPKLAEALHLLDAWGFVYRTSMVWVKDHIGMGYWARQQHELLLIATKGTPPTPAPADRPSSVITAPVGRHSAKPAEVYTVIERMFPGLPRVELFARAPRDGWARWGFEA
jgi:N6-adenosine-specific RNA methylase IME4